MRKLLIIAGALAAVLTGLIVAALLLVDVNRYHDEIQAQMEKKLQRKVTLGAMGLRLIPLSIRIEDFSIGEAPEFASPRPFVSAREVQVSVGLIALLQKRVEVRSVEILDPQVELIKDRAGKWNYSTLGGSSQSAPSHSSPAVSLDDFELRNGTIAVNNREAGASRSTYDRIDVTVKNYAPGRHFTATFSVHLAGKGKQEVALALEGVAGGADLDGKLSLAEVTAGPAMISGGGTISSRGNVVTGKGSLKATEARLKDPLQIDYDLQYDRTSGKLTAAPLTARMGALRLTGRADAETNVTPLVFHAAIRSENAPVAELLKVANAFGVAEGVSGTGSLSLDLIADGKGGALSYSGSVAIRTASIATSPSAKPIEIDSANAKLVSSAPPSGTIQAGKLAVDQIVLTPVKANYKLDAGVLHLDPVSAGVFGGQVDGTIAMDTRARQSSISAKAKLTNVDASRLLAATTSVRSFSGTLSGNADLKLAPPPGQEPARGLNGSVQVLLTGGKLAGIHLLNEMASLGKFLGAAPRSPEPFTNISKLAGTLHIQNGSANTDDLQMDFDGGSMAATGTAGLADQVLNMKVTTVLGREASQTAGGSQVGGFMSTVLGNSKGELVVPAIVTGTFAKPHFAPDFERITKMKLGGLLPTKENPAAMGSSILGMAGSLTGKAKADGAKASPMDKAKPFLDMLNSMKKQPDQKAR